MSNAPATPAATPPVPTASSSAIFGSAFPLIADTASRLDVTKAKALRAHGVKTVFRYYSHLPPSLPGKDLQPEEAKIILGEGLSIGSVFQHYNNCFRTFENNWGKEDAEQALRMAEAAGQPEGSAIYFGVDADWPYAVMRDPIIKYFDDIKRAFEGSNIAVGIYSNGCLCNAVREKGLAQYFWLSGSTGHSGTQAFYNTSNWTLFQNALDIAPSQVGYAIDANLANPSTQGYFGQWFDKGARLASHLTAKERFGLKPAQLFAEGHRRANHRERRELARGQQFGALIESRRVGDLLGRRPTLGDRHRCLRVPTGREQFRQTRCERLGVPQKDDGGRPIDGGAIVDPAVTGGEDVDGARRR